MRPSIKAIQKLIAIMASCGLFCLLPDWTSRWWRLQEEISMTVTLDRQAFEHSKQFPYGDFSKVHRCGVLSAEGRAGQYQHCDIEKTVAHLHGMLDARKGAPASRRTRAASPGKTPRGRPGIRAR